MLKQMVGACLCCFCFSLPAFALPEYDNFSFCRKLAAPEGMWIHECVSMEMDCKTALSQLRGERTKYINGCVKKYGSMKSYCALLLCADPHNETNIYSDRVFNDLPSLMKKAEKKHK